MCVSTSPMLIWVLQWSQCSKKHVAQHWGGRGHISVRPKVLRVWWPKAAMRKFPHFYQFRHQSFQFQLRVASLRDDSGFFSVSFLYCGFFFTNFHLASFKFDLNLFTFRLLNFVRYTLIELT